MILILNLIILSYSQVNSKLNCVDSGECLLCSSQEMNEEYCKNTGKKMRVICKGYGTTINDYRSCKYTAQDDQFYVFVFQVAMALIGGISFWGVQSRKHMNMTRFEHRKQSRLV